jgi:restriction endonuclease Mrr
MSKPRSPQVYAVPNRGFAKDEGKRLLKRIRGMGIAKGEEVRLIFPILKPLNPFVFEEVLLAALEKCDYHIIRPEKQTKDNGIDGSFAYGGYFYVIQAKLYGSEANPDHLKMFAHALTWHQAARGFFFHTGRATDAFKEEAERYAPMIEVVSGTKLGAFLLGQQTLFVRKPLTGAFPERANP